MENLIDRLKQFDLGLRRGTVSLAPFSKKWAHGFDHIKSLLVYKLPECQIEHVGSTAINECCAKPILDIVIWHNRATTFQQETDSLVNMGFTAKGEYGISGRCFFNLYDEDENDYVHLHAFPIGHPNGDEIRKFTEKLNANPEMVSAYNKHKQGLVDSGVSRKDYPDAKSSFIRPIIGEQAEHIHFAKLKKSQVEWLKPKLLQGHIAEWMHGVGLENCLRSIDCYHSDPDGNDLWIGYLSGRPLAYLITSVVDKIAKDWEQIDFGSGDACTLDVFILEPNLIGKGYGTKLIKQFIEELPSQISDLLIDPEKTNARAIHVYEKVGFKPCFDFIAPWHPVPHLQMHLRKK